MKRYKWYTVFLLAALTLSLQSCLDIGSDNPFQSKNTGKNGQIGVNSTQQAEFSGKIYFTLNRNLYMLDGHLNLKKLTQGMDVRNPAISPDGKWIAFANFFHNYSDLMLMPTSGGAPQTLISGNGKYLPNPASPMGAPKSTFLWLAQPAWNADSNHLLFVSDMDKLSIGPCNVDDFLLDPLIFLRLSLIQRNNYKLLLIVPLAMGGYAIQAIVRVIVIKLSILPTVMVLIRARTFSSI